ncbi:T9SS type A sorting domain-containing protein [Bacteroidota bacterium]
MKKYLFVFFTLLLILSINKLLSLDFDSCYCKPEWNSLIEYDFIIDSCNINIWEPDCTNLLLDNCYYHEEETAKRIFFKSCIYLWFDVEALSISPAPSDTIIEVDWRDIDTIYNEIRDGFQKLENEFGNVTLRKMYPDITLIPEGQSFYIIFNEYVHMNSVYIKINNIEKTNAEIDCLPKYINVIDPISNTDNFQTMAYPSPASNHLNIISKKRLLVSEICIYSYLGKIINTYKIEYLSNSNDLNLYLINNLNLIDGFYYIKIENQLIKFIVRN